MARPMFYEDRCVLQFLVTASGEVNDEGVQRQEMDSRILDCLPGSLAESLPAIFTCKIVQPVSIRYCKYDASMQNAAGALSLCALHPGLLPSQNDGGTTGAGKCVRVSCWVMGTCLSSPLPTKEAKEFGQLVSEGGPKETVLQLNELFKSSAVNR